MNRIIAAITVTCFLMVGIAYADEPDMVVPESEDQGTMSTMIVDNPELNLSAMTSITSKAAYMTIYSGLGVSDTVKLWKDAMWLRDNTDIRDVELFLNSPGGSAFDGIAMANWIDKLQSDSNFTFNVRASGIIASAAVPIFAVCEVRTALPGTIFMVHEAAIFKWPGRETASDIRSQNDLMRMLADTYTKILVDNSTLSSEEWEDKILKTTWFSLALAEEWGLLGR
jgi:ATP-dependent protease ClpP protease subunit